MAAKRKKPGGDALLRAIARLTEYPAVFWPTEMGGFDVFFPNFAGLKAYGHDLATAKKAAVEMLSAHLTLIIKEGEEPPPASDPERLVPDEDEPAGTQLHMVEPERSLIAARLGLKKPPRGQVLATWGRLGR